MSEISWILTLISVILLFVFSINDKNLEEFAYDDEEKCDLSNKYFSFISKLDEANAPLPDINVSIQEISDIIQILHPNKASGPDVISHKMLKQSPFLNTAIT
jgi:hypothetical protein